MKVSCNRTSFGGLSPSRGPGAPDAHGRMIAFSGMKKQSKSVWTGSISLCEAMAGFLRAQELGRLVTDACDAKMKAP